MGSRFFLITLLPELSFDTARHMSLEEVWWFLRLNVSSHDMNIVDRLRALDDLENIRSYLTGQPMTAIGRIPHDLLQEQLENDECPLPELEEFFRLYPTTKERAANAHMLRRYFFKNQPSNLPPFVKQYFQIEDISRHLMAFLRAEGVGKSYRMDPEGIGFDIQETKSWPEAFLPLLDIWASHRRNAKGLEQAVAYWKFTLIETLAAHSPPFSLDHVLVYLLQLRIVERFNLFVPGSTTNSESSKH